MADGFGFVDGVLDSANRFNSVALLQMKMSKKILGTKVIVKRVKKDSKYSKVFGSLYTSENLDDEQVDEFEYTVLINKNDMLKLYQRNIDQLEFSDNENFLQKGDVLCYRRNDIEFKFKITEVETFSDAGGILYKYTLSGIIETIND